MNPVASTTLHAGAPVSLRQWLARQRAAFWEGLQMAAWARAQCQLLAFADQCESTQPSLAKELRAAARSGPLL